MAGGLSSCLPIAMRLVGDAIKLDSQDCKKEAYCQYLSCCVYISQILKDDAWDKDIKLAYNADSAKLFKLLQQCQERALTIISSEVSHSGSSQSSSPVLPQPQISPAANSQDNLHRHTDTAPYSPGKQSMGYLRSSSGQLLNFPSPPATLPSAGCGNSSMKTTPVCPRVGCPDKRLMDHHLRVTKYNTSKTDKTLTYLRRMAENNQIAKAREESIRKKVWERQQRLQQEANRRFGSAVLDSKEEQEQRALYTKILEYEQDMVWPRQLRAKLKESPEDAALIKHVIEKIFSSKDHPLRQFLLQYQYQVYKKLVPLMKDVNFPKENNLKQNSDSVPNNEMPGKSDVCPLSEDSNKTSDREEKPNVEEASEHKEGLEEQTREDDKNSVVNSDESRELQPKQTDDRDDMNSSQENDQVIGRKENVSNINQEEQEEERKKEDEEEEKMEDKGNQEREKDEFEGEDGKREDIEENSSEETQHLKNMCQNEEVFNIVKNVLEDIINDATKIDHDTHTDKDDNKQDKTLIDKENDDNNLEEEKDENKQQLVNRNDDDEVAKTTVYVDNKTNSTTDLNKVDGLSKGTKHQLLMRIKSFDVESEFESLEDDMFESESEDEEENREEKEEKHDENVMPNNKDSYSKHDSGDSSSEISQNHLENTTKEGENSDKNRHDSDTSKNVQNSSEQDNSDKSCEKTEPVISEEEELEMTRKQLKDIFVDMHFFLEKLKGFIILAYEELATPVGHEQCYIAVEYPFFQPLWPLLLGVLRRVNFDKELLLGSAMTKRIRHTPAEMGVIDRLCLTDQKALKSTGNQFPYQTVVDQLHKVTISHCPLEKIDCIVHVLRGICQCVEDYWEAKGKPRHCAETSMGCDDLLPVLVYVIVRSGMAQLVSECVAMEEFIPEGYLMGEEGYCLTTLQTALAYLTNVDATTCTKTQELS